MSVVSGDVKRVRSILRSPSSLSPRSRRILVTGGSGLVGSGIKLALLAQSSTEPVAFSPAADGDGNDRWYFVDSKDADLKDSRQTEELFQSIRPTHVIHLAAKVGGLFMNMGNKAQMYQENTLINMNVLCVSKSQKVEKVISMLSTCVFPDRIAQYPFDESAVHLGPPHPSNEGYAYAKRMLEVHSRLLHEESQAQAGGDQSTRSEFLTVVPTNVFGPFDNFHLEDGHVFPALVHRALLSRDAERPLVVFGSGKPMRQFIYSVDLGKLLIWSLDHYHDFREPLILCPDIKDEFSIQKIATEITKHIHSKGIINDLSKSDGQFKKTASNQKLRSLFPDFEFTPFPQAVKETCEWFLANYSSIRK